MRSRLATLLVAALVVTGLAVVIDPAAASAGSIPAPGGLTADFGTNPNYTPRNPTLRWDTVAGATSYRVQISTNDSFASSIYDTTTYGHQVTPPSALPIGTLYWRVAATVGGGSGPFAQQSFAESWNTAPQLQSPTDYDPNNTTVPNPTALTYPDQPAVFSWTALDGATSYTLQIDDAPDFIGAQTFTTPNTSYSLTDPQTVGQQFYWRVQASSGSTGVASPWSATRSFLYDWPSVPVMKTPSDGSSVTDVAFTWDPVSGAKNYQLQVSPNGDWTNNLTIDLKTLVSTSYTPPNPLGNGSYFWRVRSIDSAGHFGSWSTPFSFTRQWVDRPVLQVPAYDPSTPDAITNIGSDVEFRWSAVPHAADYEIQFAVDQNFSQTVSCFTNHTEWTPYVRTSGSAVEPGSCPTSNSHVPIWASGTTYYWRVRGLDGAGNILGLWSDPGQFIRNPPAPALAGPDDGTTVDVPTLSWSAVAGAEKYKVTLTTKTGSSVGGFPLTTYNTSATPLAVLSAAQSPYSWTVQAIDATGFSSVSPHPHQFSVPASPAAATGDTPTPVAPADGTEARIMPSLSWTPVAGAAKYVVHIQNSSGFELTPLVSNDAYPAYSPPNVPLAAGLYTWWVEARDASNASLSTGPSSTFRVLPLDSLTKADYLTPARCDIQTSCTAENDTPTFSWNPVPNAALYEVTIAADSHFTNVVRTYTTAYTMLTPRESLLDSQAGQAYYWFVRPCFDAAMTDCGPGADDGSVNGDAGAFRKQSSPVAPISPDSPSQVPDQITFTWQDYLSSENGTGASQEAAKYHLQVATAADFTQTSIIDDQTVNATSYTSSTKTYPEGPLYWRVQAIDNSGNALTWSAPKATTTGWSVTKASPPPQQLSPSAGAKETGVPYLSWRPQDYASSYTVEVYKNGDINASPDNLVKSASTKFAAWSPTVGLPQGDYVWRVRRVDGSGAPGPWSPMRSFHLEQQAPTLTSPAPGAELNSSDVVFSWTPVAGAAQYRWQLSSSPGFTSSTSQTTLTSSWSPISTIADGTWYWRVQVLDGANNVLATSGTRTFNKDATPPTVPTVGPTSSVPITPKLTATFSEPVQNVTAGTFRVVVAGTSSPIAGQVQVGDVAGVPTATWQSLKPLMPGQNYTAMLTSGILDDPAGNPLTPRSWTFRTNTQVENDSPALVEHWDRDSAKGSLGGSYDASKAAGSSASYTFTGTGVSVLGTRMKSGGYAAVYLDGVKQTSTASFYNAKTQYRKVIWSRSRLANGPHTIQLRVLGTKPSRANDRWVYLDGFQVGKSQVDQVNSAVTEAFARVRAGMASGRTYDTASHATSGDTGGRPSYSVQFRGTGVSVYAVRSKTASRAALYLDGRLKSTVDLRATSTYVTSVAAFSSLADRVHTLRIDVVGTKSGVGSNVGIDYLRVS